MTVSAVLDATPGPSARITVSGIKENRVADPWGATAGQWNTGTGFGTGGAGTYTLNVPITGPDGSNTTCLAKKWTTGCTSWGSIGTALYAAGGIRFTVDSFTPGVEVSAWVKTTAATAKTFTIAVFWYDSGGTYLGATTSTGVSVPGNTWQQLMVTIPTTLPYPTATTFLVVVDMPTGAGFWQANEWLYVTWAMIAPDGWVFPGTAAAASVQIFRGDGTSETRVSGDDQQIPAGAVYLTDYRVPPGKTISYRVVLYSAAGVVVFNGASGSLAVPAIDPSYAWVMDPEDPTRAMLLPLMAGTDAQVGHDSAGVAAPPLSGLPMWIAGPRMQLSRPFVVKTSSLAETVQFAKMIEPGGQLLFRPGSALRHDTGLVYVGAGSITEVPNHPYEGPARWSFDGAEVADDDWPVVVDERTWLDVEGEAATWLALEAMYATWLAVEQG